jgi:hypothetical protein
MKNKKILRLLEFRIPPGDLPFIQPGVPGEPKVFPRPRREKPLLDPNRPFPLDPDHFEEEVERNREKREEERKKQEEEWRKQREKERRKKEEERKKETEEEKKIIRPEEEKEIVPSSVFFSMRESFDADLPDYRKHADYTDTKKDTLYYVIRYPGITVREIEKKTGHDPYRIKSALHELEKEKQITIGGGMSKDEPYKHYPNLDYEPPRMPPSTSMSPQVNNQILAAFGEDNMGLGIADLMALTGYNMIFIQNAMDNLESAGLVRLEGDTYFSNE